MAQRVGSITYGVDSGQELAYSANESGSTLALSTTMTSLSCSITLPLSTRPIWIEAAAWADPTTAAAALAAGTVAIQVQDDQGTPVVVGADIVTFEGNSGAAGFFQLKLRCRLAPNTTSRTYTLMASRGGDSTFRASILNANGGSSQFRSYLAAFLG